MPLTEQSSLEDSLARILGEPASSASNPSVSNPVVGPSVDPIAYGGVGFAPFRTDISLGAPQPYTPPPAAVTTTLAPAAAPAPVYTPAPAAPAPAAPAPAPVYTPAPAPAPAAPPPTPVSSTPKIGYGTGGSGYTYNALYKNPSALYTTNPYSSKR